MNALLTIILDAARGLLQGHELSMALAATLVVLGLTLSGITGRAVSWAQTLIYKP
jgi:hypothetical protein